jgi:hypothetical protein
VSDASPYTLKKPIVFGSQTIDRLDFREPVAKDLRGVDLSARTIDANLTFASRLCGQPMPVIDQLGMADLEEVLKIVEGFLSPGPGTGPQLAVIGSRTALPRPNCGHDRGAARVLDRQVLWLHRR